MSGFEKFLSQIVTWIWQNPRTSAIIAIIVIAIVAPGILWWAFNRVAGALLPVFLVILAATIIWRLFIPRKGG